MKVKKSLLFLFLSNLCFTFAKNKTMMKVTNELKLKVLTDKGLHPHLEGDKAVATIDYTAIDIKVIKAKGGSATLRVSFELAGVTICQIEDQTILKDSSLRIMTTDGFKCQGKIVVE